jgi:hypothetical protein
MGLHAAAAISLASLRVPARPPVESSAIHVEVVVEEPAPPPAPEASATGGGSERTLPRGRGRARPDTPAPPPTAPSEEGTSEAPSRWSSLRGDSVPSGVPGVASLPGVAVGVEPPRPRSPLELPERFPPRKPPPPPPPRKVGIVVNIPLACPRCLLVGAGRAIEGSLTRNDEMRAEMIAADEKIRHQTGLEPEPRPPQQPINPGLGIAVPIAGGSFDLTEAIIGDEAIRPEKARYLDLTRDARAAVAAEARLRDERAAVRRLPARLEQIWRHERLSASARRRLLFDLWDECEEEGVGLTARTTIAAFIRRRLPAQSTDAYPREELEALNAERHSIMRFAPYGE